jgi:hypothetical protein
MGKDARFVEVTEPQEERRDNLGLEPRGFEWIANGIGALKVKPHSINVDFVVQGYRFKANLTKEAEFSLFSFLTMLPMHVHLFHHDLYPPQIASTWNYLSDGILSIL